MNRRLSAAVALVGGLLIAGAAIAQGKPASERQPERKFNWTQGPNKVAVGHEISLDLPADYIYLGGQQAKDLMVSMGNFQNEQLLGVVADRNDTSWFALLEYIPDGYVKDDEKIDADDLLKSYKEGTEEANKERVQKGFHALHVDGWETPPSYDKTQHRLTWALRARSDAGLSVNYDTRVLGRRGYLSLVLLTGAETFAQNKVHANKLLDVTKFDQGARYEDFDKSKGDKVAEYGLTGLILGGAGLGAAKLVKLGLFAKFGKFLLLIFAKAGKGIILLFGGIAAAIGKLFGRKSDDDNSGAPPPSDPPVAGGSPPPPSDPPPAV